VDAGGRAAAGFDRAVVDQIVVHALERVADSAHRIVGDKRNATKLTMRVLAIGGGTSSGDGPRLLMETVANDVQGLNIPGAGHFVAEEAPPPDAVLAGLTKFLAPYRDGGPAR
jgi:pimeloyl-ACP methyl ester carboxylesterase